MEITDKDIEKLDFILNRMVETDWLVSANDLHREGLYDEYKNNTELIEKDFKYLLSVFDKMNIGIVSMTADAEHININSDAIIFHRNGGFKKYKTERQDKIMLETINRVDSDFEKQLDNRIKELTAENLEYQKTQRKKDEKIKQLTKDNLRLGNWDIRFRWLFYILSAIIGFIIKWLIDK
ncbi:hypothetical protein [Bizionia sp. M204]|uniref:hypothetical protein n=1 Tax=Bizionia sp. M204 TaxID=2675331 RepID=UPI002045A1FA|nr:hypothetical protein [Bizionia sp. M204]UPS92057.1 hypothetical protein GMA17_10140 [Bizionia sp. M204]